MQPIANHALLSMEQERYIAHLILVLPETERIKFLQQWRRCSKCIIQYRMRLFYFPPGWHHLYLGHTWRGMLDMMAWSTIIITLIVGSMPMKLLMLLPVVFLLHILRSELLNAPETVWAFNKISQI